MMKNEFSQPEIPGRDHRMVEVEDGLYERLARDFLGEGESRSPPDWDPLEGFTPALLAALDAAQEEIAGLDTEQVRIFGPDGALIQRGQGTHRSVGFDPSHHVCGAVALHNHPQGTPPSIEDAIALVRWGFGLVRVVTPSGSAYDLATARRNLAGLLADFRSLEEQSWAVAEACIRGQGLKLPDPERLRRRQHALWMELARRNLLCYARSRWTSKPGSTARGG